MYLNSDLTLAFYFTVLMNNQLILGMLTENFSVLFLKNGAVMFSVGLCKFNFFQIE